LTQQHKKRREQQAKVRLAQNAEEYMQKKKKRVVFYCIKFGHAVSIHCVRFSKDFADHVYA